FSSPHPAPSLPYTLSLHDALPISLLAENCIVGKSLHDSFSQVCFSFAVGLGYETTITLGFNREGPTKILQRDLASLKGDLNGKIDRKSTRLNSSHSQISYAVFCLK